MSNPPADLTLRSATVDDLPALRTLWFAFETWLNTVGEPEQIDPRKFDGFAQLAFGARPLCHVVLALRGATPIGYLVDHVGVWMDDMAPALFVADLYADERRSGVGRALMEFARETASAADCKHLFWTVWRKNTAAQAFYASLGAEVFSDEILMRWTAAVLA